MKNFLYVPNPSGRVGQKNFPGENKFREIWHLDWTAVFEFWWVNGAGLIFLSISHSHFQLRELLVWETLLCQQAQDTLLAQHQLVIRISTGKDQNHRTFWVERDSQGWSSPTVNDPYGDQVHDLGVICTMFQAADLAYGPPSAKRGVMQNWESPFPIETGS